MNHIRYSPFCYNCIYKKFKQNLGLIFKWLPCKQHITTISVFIESIWPNILFSSDTQILFVHVRCTHVLLRKRKYFKLCQFDGDEDATGRALMLLFLILKHLRPSLLNPTPSYHLMFINFYFQLYIKDFIVGVVVMQLKNVIS